MTFQISSSSRIVLLGSSGFQGGLQIHFQELESFLLKEGHCVFTINVDDGNDASNRVQENSGVWVRNGRPGIRSRLLKAWDWFYAIQKAKAFDPDLFISTACGRGYAGFGRSLSKNAFGLFQVVTDDYQPLDSTLSGMLKGHGAVAVQSMGLIAPFRSKMHFNGPLGILPCFHQIQYSETCAKPLQSNEPLKLVYFGRLAENKGLSLLLHVLSELDNGVEWFFDIWGRGKAEAKLRDMIAGSHVLSQRVTFKGPYPAGEQYNQLLASYHGLVAPSQATEGLPLVLLEAASAGLPFLSCRVGAIGDCEIGNPDVLVIETGVNALREGLRKFLEALCAGLYDNKRLKTWFENNHTRQQYEQCWREMLLSPKDYFNNE